VSSIEFEYFGQDDALMPQRGTIFTADFRHYSRVPNSTGNYQQATLRTTHFIPLTAQGSFFGSAGGGTSFGETGLGLAGFRLGGAFNLSGYGRNELLGSQYFLVQAGYLHRLFTLSPIFGGAVYAMGFYEVAKMYAGTESSSSVPNDGSVAVVMKSLIGPIYIGGSVGDRGHRKWWFGIGRIF